MVSIRKISIVLVAVVVLSAGSITGAFANYLAATDHVSHLVSIYDADTGVLHQQINTIALGATLAHPLYSAFGAGDDLLVNDYINGRILNFAKGAGDTWNTTPTVVTALPGLPAGIDVGADYDYPWGSIDFRGYPAWVARMLNGKDRQYLWYKDFMCRHNDGANCMFADGHVRWYKSGSFQSSMFTKNAHEDKWTGARW